MQEENKDRGRIGISQSDKRKQRVFWFLVALFLIIAFLLIARSASALDKWFLCGNVNLSGQDCDDFWNLLTNGTVINYYNNTYVAEINQTNVTYVNQTLVDNSVYLNLTIVNGSANDSVTEIYKNYTYYINSTSGDYVLKSDFNKVISALNSSYSSSEEWKREKEVMEFELNKTLIMAELEFERAKLNQTSSMTDEHIIQLIQTQARVMGLEDSSEDVYSSQVSWFSQYKFPLFILACVLLVLFRGKIKEFLLSKPSQSDLSRYESSSVGDAHFTGFKSKPKFKPYGPHKQSEEDSNVESSVEPEAA